MKDIKIPFGAKDSELVEATYFIPEGMEAVIEGDKVIIRRKESEDERIRKNCIHFLELQKEHHASTIEIDKCIAWLEKQKPVEWSEEDEKMMDSLICSLTRISHNTKTDSTSPNYIFFEEVNWLKSLKQRIQKGE